MHCIILQGTLYAGAILGQGTAVAQSILEISGCTFLNNTGDYAGAIYIENALLSTQNCTFLQNQVWAILHGTGYLCACLQSKTLLHSGHTLAEGRWVEQTALSRCPLSGVSYGCKGLSQPDVMQDCPCLRQP
jgi:hypothetical protein